MRVGILGTRGIPNNYGGFERLAEKLSLFLVEKGFDVTVYNPDEYPYKRNEWNGVKIKSIFSKESVLGIWGTFLYDYFCLTDAIKQKYDIILNLGYVPASFFFFLKRFTKAKFITNMDGLEWKRKKWNFLIKIFIRYCEARAVKLSDFLIADNPGIERYYREKYGINHIKYIGYGAELFYQPNEKFLCDFNLIPYKYYLLVSRIEPENNIEMILDGYQLSCSTEPFLVIGELRSKFAKYLLKKYASNPNIKFVGGIYDYNKLCTLRCYSKLYFHGHSVGGTNPSLLEAMASKAYIAVHDNPFNRYVIGDDAFFFKDKNDVADILRNYTDEFRTTFTCNNIEKVKKIYNWQNVCEAYIKVFSELLS